MKKHEILQKEIITLSNSEDWMRAREEWFVEGIEIVDDPHVCLCTQHGLKELCYLHNAENGNKTMVGNVCVRNFMGLDVGKSFVGLKKLREDPSRMMHPDLYDLACERGWLAPIEKKFYNDMYEWRRPTVKQLAWIKRINAMVLIRVNKRDTA